MSKNKITKKSVYILTEGNTEEAYFSRIAEIVGIDTEWEYSVKVEVREIINGSKTDPINIVKEAKKAKKGYDEIWVVFDKDRERDEENQKAIALAVKSKINVAFSSISFEHWLILHFEKNNVPFERSDCESRGDACICNGRICASTYLKASTRYPNFKKGYSLLYDDLKEKNILAIENAAWLRHQQSPYTSIHLLNPYSDIDLLICELLNLKRVEYSSIEETFIFDGIAIRLLNFNKINNDITILLNLDNQRTISFPINNLQPFTLIDENNNVFPYNEIPSSILNPSCNQNIELVFTVLPHSQLFRLKITAIEKYILVDIPFND